MDSYYQKKKMKSLIILEMLSLFVYANEYRFDYEWSDQAGGWLKYHVVPAVWDEARLRCHAEGAVLASPLNRDLKTAVISFIKKQKHSTPRSIFTGVHATFSRGDYSSIEGVPLYRMSITWAAGEPDNYDNSESCLAMSTDFDGLMADRRCTDVLPYVCYKKYTQLSISTDCGTSDREYILEPKTGSCYKFHERDLVWSEAYMTCVAEGGYLAVINDNLEAEVIRQIFTKHPDKTVHSKHKSAMSVGIHDWGHLGSSFMTIHGETLQATYSNWAGGEPNNATNDRTGDSGQYCGIISRSGHLDDYYCNIPALFLCEKNPKSLNTF